MSLEGWRQDWASPEYKYVLVVVSHAEMPRLPDGSPIDLCLSPAGIVTRQEQGILLEGTTCELLKLVEAGTLAWLAELARMAGLAPLLGIKRFR